MNKDTITGQAKQIQGRLQDAKGDFTDDPRDDVQGKARVIEGKVQEAVGKVKDAVKKEVNKA